MAENTLVSGNSILLSTKRKVGIHDDYTEFDEGNFIDHVNSALFILNQIGIGKEGFRITGSTETWSDFLGPTSDEQTSVIVSWVGIKVGMLFDPPTSSQIAEAKNAMLKELEWRFYITRNYIGEVGSEESGSYTSLESALPYIYSTEYKTLDYDFAYDYFTKNSEAVNSIGACSSVRNGVWYGRNFDFTYDNLAQFIVKTDKTIGVCGKVPGLTNRFVQSGTESDLYKIVPFMLVDGINSDGVICSVNVVPLDKGETTATIPAIEEQQKICSLMVVRYVLDHFKTAAGAVAWLRDYASIYTPKFLKDMGYDEHFQISDSTKSFVVEIVDNAVVVKDISDRPYITNFFIDGVTFTPEGKVYTPADVEGGHLPSSQGITDRGCGLERYNMIVDNWDSCSTRQGMTDLMKSLFYTKSYKESTNPTWYTEFVGINELTVDSTPAEYADTVAAAREAYETRTRDNSKGTWQTCHTSVYNMSEKCLYVMSQEFTDDVFKVKL